MLTGMTSTNDRAGDARDDFTVRQPKLDGNRVALRGRVTPDQHQRARRAAAQRGLSLSDYLGSLIDADTGVRAGKRPPQEAFDIPA